jgi:hypothetical protein
MKNDFTNHDNSSDSSIYLGKLKIEDFAHQEEINEFRAASEKIFREEFLKRQELEEEANIHIDNLLSQVELRVEEGEDYFTDSGKLWESFYKLFGPFFDCLNIDIDFQNYQVIKKKEEGLIAFIMKYLKLLKDFAKKVINAILFPDGKLSFEQWVSKQIEKLQQKLSGGILSKKEIKMVLKELAELRDLKFKMKLIGLFLMELARFCESFEVILAKATERRATEEDKKVEKTSSKEKEAAKEVHEIIEIKVNAEGRYQIIVPNYLLDFSSGSPRPITLTKPELNLLSDSLKNILSHVQRYNRGKENSGVKETKVNENKQEKSEALKKTAPVAPVTQQETGGMWQPEKRQDYKTSYDKLRRKSLDKSNGDKLIRRPAKEPSFNPKDFPKVGYFQAPSETNGKSHANARDEPKQSSMNNAQPLSECSNVKIDSYVDLIGKPQEASPKVR